ncbi:MAG: G1 family glutamic endopeptidase [Acidimicrobiales bacterium]
MHTRGLRLRRGSAKHIMIGSITLGLVGASLAVGDIAGATTIPPVPQTSSRFVPQATAIQSGLVSLRTEKQADGAVRYSYSLPHSSLTTIIPPSGFAPLSASASQLQDYGFPPRPTSAGALASWTKAMSAYRDTIVPNLVFAKGGPLFSHPLQSTGTSPPGSTRGTSQPVRNGANANWSGYTGNSSSHTHWITAEGTWMVPNVGTQCGGSSTMSIWTGLGGVTSTGNFQQSGIAFNEGIPGQVSLWTPFWELFEGGYNVGPYELYGAGTIALSIQPGNVVFSSTYFDRSLNEVKFYLENLTNGQVAEYFAGSAITSYDGNTADWITEFPLGGPGAQFQQFAIVTAYDQASTGQWLTAAQSAPEEDWVNGLLNPGPLGSDGKSFAEGFQGCR